MLSQCSIIGVATIIQPQIRREAMKVALAPSYRTWLFALLPKTLGVGTAGLWLRSMDWLLRVDTDGLTLRYHRRVPWSSIKRIGISRSYLDGHVREVRIHHRGGVSKVPLGQLRDGEEVAGLILSMFKRTCEARTGGNMKIPEPTRARFVARDRLGSEDAPVARHRPARNTLVKTEVEIANVAPKPRDTCGRDGRVDRVPRRAAG
jgi:hypothetical protein